MKGIQEGRVQMRPRWHFALISVLILLGVLVACLTMVYAVSLVLYLLHVNGEWFAPSFGLRGWLSFINSLPWLLMGLLMVFVLILEILVRRYAFVYKKPLITSVLGIMTIVLAGGFLVALTPLHNSMARFDRDGMLPPPLNGLYRRPPMGRSPDLYRGMIVEVAHDRLVVVSRDGTTTVLIDPRTRLPYGNGFEKGDFVIVIGDRVATGTIHAFGVRGVESVDEDELPDEIDR